ncbi:MAG: hypothetical protein QOK11_1571 [Pseudonocardiales bacterium]|nr:hypothetical protein [Pseudonocardiales bacterium]
MSELETIAASRPLRKDAARNRELLIDAAREVFAERGLEATLDDVAHHAGLGVGTAYRHFSNKYELLSALMDQMIEQFVAGAERAIAVEDPWQGLVDFLEDALSSQVNDRGLRHVLMGFHDPDKFDKIHDQLSGMLEQVLGRAKRAGAVRADIGPSDIGFLIAMLCTVADIADNTAPDLWRRYLALSLEGLKPGGPALPATALTDPEFRKAMANHKQTMSRNLLSPNSR